jgi:hypothetical protein
MTELEQANEELRQAVAARLAAKSIDERGPLVEPDEEDDAVPVDWILQGERELAEKRAATAFTGDGLLHEDTTPAAEDLLLRALDVIRDRRTKYGGPRKHFAVTVALVNSLFAHKLHTPLTEADWAQVMILDKLARYNGAQKTADGPIDLAGYAACLAEVDATPHPSP